MMKNLIYFVCAVLIITVLVKCTKTNSKPEEIEQPISVSITLDSVGPTSTEVRVR